jgi:hypothetical protein
MKKKQEIIVIRITEIEKEMIRELRQKKSINVSSLVRNLIQEYYEKNI